MKAVVIIAQVVNDRNYERYAIKQLEDAGSVVIIDVTPLLYPRVFEEQYAGRKLGLNVTYVRTLDELQMVLENESDLDYLFTLLGVIGELNYRVYELLMPFSSKLCILALSGFPSCEMGVDNGLIRQLITKIRRELSLRSVVKKALYLLELKLLDRKSIKAKYLVSCGASVTAQYSNMVGSETEIIESCSYDYIQSLREGCSSRNDEYVVFLDENLISHSDYKINDVKVEDEGIYYRELLRLFAYIESKYSVRVVVAAHPRSDIEYTRRKFPGHEVTIRETAGLVKHCKACVTHASTSSNFAVIYNKPLIFVSSDRMRKTRRANYILASWFGRYPVNMSNPGEYSEIESHMFVDEELYSKFFREYISYSLDCEYGYKSIIN